MALSVVASLSSCGCQRRAAIETPIAELQSCAEDARCETGLCDSANGNPLACLRTCVQGCRGADLCTRLESGNYACVPEKAGLCKPCETDSDCPQVADRCLVLGTTRYCGRDCSFDDQCPPSFRCGEATTVSGALAPKQCQPTSGTCECIAATAGQQVPCDVTNASGTCSGISVCRPPVGYDLCTARTPTAEVCNGLDDDCNGMTDENLGDITCGTGECQRAAAACANGTPQPCTPGLPSAEVCNSRDDNCDGTVDDGFNLSTDVNHCGACNQPCVLTNAVPKCELGACAVDRCVAGWTDLDRVAANGCEYPCVVADGGGMEICDGLDNDCNGVVDDGFDLITDPANCGQCNLTCSVPGTTVATYACVARVCGIGSCVSGRGNCNQSYGDGCEVDLGTDVSHCGLCGQACVTPNATPGCDAGSCAVVQCNNGFGDCNGQVSDGCEVNTNTALSNCGGCGNACSAANATSTCVNGSCGFTCAANWWDADGLAANGCEYACIRTAGGVEACDNIDNDCDNRVDEDFDLTSNAAHCGLCNRACSAPFSTTTCSASTCGITACDPGRANCNAVYVDGCEVNTGTDLNNCGACNTTCSAANGTPRCQAGTCGIQACNAGFANCNNQVADGCEINTNTNLANCGACNAACTAANGTPSCVGGACAVLSCNPAFANCNGVAADGCEVSTGNDLNNCGACNVACSTPNATPRCQAGACGINSCNPGYTDCNGLVPDGCEVLTGGSDVANCGGCGTVCATPNATPRCTTGTCGILSCNLGFANCNGQVNDGCEINTNTSLANCGSCGAQCAPAHASPVCVAGSCGIGACQAGWVNLNGLVADGCEYGCVPTNGGVEACDGVDNNCNGGVDETFTLATDVTNCGACGNVCAAANVSVPRCVAGACGVQTCNAGFANCNGTFPDGCEVNTNTSLSNCGACGAVCTTANATPVCTSGACQIASCLGNNRDCNVSPVDGCEVNVLGNVNACGLCGNVCPARPNSSRTCSGTTCGYVCTAGFVDVDGAAANGCEYACSPSGVDDPDDGSVDQDCDGIDGSVVKGIFVATSGSDLNPGTRAAPKLTVQAGINAASALQPHVYVSEGIYDEAISLRSGISVFGGYSRANNWARSAASVVTLRNGVVSGGRIVAVSGNGIVAPTTVAYVTIRALDTVTTGASVYGLYCNNCTALTLRTTLVISGSAGPGAAGGGGSTGATGNDGLNGTAGTCNNNIAGAAGGAGGLSACGTHGGAGGRGGNYGSNAGVAGSPGIVGTPGGNAGGGGDPGGTGAAGTSGSAGTAGANGGGGSGGALVGGFFVANAGNGGANGTDGNGGGGGGGGGGQGCFLCDDGNGNGAGGGGAGGCHGTPAAGGTPGGSSFGVFLLNSTGAVMIANNVSSGNGGSGGAGGAGGPGGFGGNRGLGATNCTGEIGAGGNGGFGGAGGRGGHGGGGAGGVSYGVYRSGSAVNLAGNALSAGSGGFGGPSSGNAGANGAAAPSL
ncbi:MAG: MopE-related protein [Archangium sp.]|nr:MopE-related protein [Archangium sp.]